MNRTVFRRWTAFALCLLCAAGLYPFSAGYADEVPLYFTMPEYLIFHQKMDETKLRENVYSRCTYPVSVNERVNLEVSERIKEMHAAAMPLLPGKKAAKLTELDSGADVWRTGTRWMSFQLVTRLSTGTEVTYLDTECRVYDMETGERVALTDIFPAESAAWQLMADAVRQQLNAYFPGEQADQEALEALCTRESLEQAQFSLTAARLMLTYRADSLYAGKNSLMHVVLWYEDIRPLMTEVAFEQTDNSRFRKVALTYDDGPAGSYTRNLLNVLRKWGASATFFVVGSRIHDYSQLVIREHDSGAAVWSHNYRHEYKFTRDQLFSWRQKMEDILNELIGVAPGGIRAPGGIAGNMIKYGYGLPFIHWSLVSGDATNEGDPKNYARFAYQVTNNVKSGDIVLMHDLNYHSSRYSDMILENLSDRGFLCMTVEELYHDAGIPLQPDQIYYSTTRDQNRAN